MTNQKETTMQLHGPGKYDDLCTHARNAAQAEGAVLFIANGEHGNGVSVQGTARVFATLPDILEALAESMRKDWAAQGIPLYQAAAQMMVTLGKAACFLDRAELRQVLVEALADGRLKREYMMRIRDSLDAVLSAGEGRS